MKSSLWLFCYIVQLYIIAPLIRIQYDKIQFQNMYKSSKD